LALANLRLLRPADDDIMMGRQSKHDQSEHDQGEHAQVGRRQTSRVAPFDTRRRAEN
jgi:hypothetical protein